MSFIKPLVVSSPSASSRVNPNKDLNTLPNPLPDEKSTLQKDGSTAPPLLFASRAYALGETTPLTFGSWKLPTSYTHIFDLEEDKKRLKLAETELGRAVKDFKKCKNDATGWTAPAGAFIGGTVGGLGTIVTHGLDLGGSAIAGVVTGINLGEQLGMWIHATTLHEAEQKLIQAQSKFSLHENRIQLAEKQLSQIKSLQDYALIQVLATRLFKENHPQLPFLLKQVEAPGANWNLLKETLPYLASSKPNTDNTFKTLLDLIVQSEKTMGLDQLKKCLTEAAQLVQSSNESAMAFIPWDQLKDFQNAPCQNVRDALANNLNPTLISLFPGYANMFKKKVGKFENLVSLMDQCMLDIQAPASIGNKKQEAVRTFHRLEREYQPTKDTPISRTAFTNLLISLDTDESVKAVVIEEMSQFPTLQMPPEEMKKYLEEQLGIAETSSEEMMMALLNLVQTTSFASSSLNFHLKLLSVSNKCSATVSEKAAQVLQSRQSCGLYQELNSVKVAEALSNTLVGNPDLKENLISKIDDYKNAIRNPDFKNPALKLWLNGEPGIGKTLLIQRLHLALNGSKDGLINIHLGGNTTAAKIFDKLRAERPLHGKTIFFDEFQQIDTFDPENQKKLIEFLKLVLSTDPGEIKLLLDDYALDFSGTTVAFASNESKHDIQALNNPTTGKALKDRFSSTKSILLTSDLGPHLPEIISQFVPQKLYSKDVPELGQNIQFTPGVEALLLKTLQKRIQEEQIQKLSGRAAVNFIVQELKDAISRTIHASGREYPFNKNGHYDCPLIFKVVNNRLVAEPPVPIEQKA
jgi:hypothetical protein